jgi:hypothetical protein
MRYYRCKCGEAQAWSDTREPVAFCHQCRMFVRASDEQPPDPLRTALAVVRDVVPPHASVMLVIAAR